MKRTFRGQYIITKSFGGKTENSKVDMGAFWSHFLTFSIWQCHISNGSSTLPYSSKCEARHCILLPDKFSHCPSENSKFLLRHIKENEAVTQATRKM